MSDIQRPKLRTLDQDKRSSENPKELVRINSTTLLIIDTWNTVDEIWKIKGTITRDVGYKWITKLESGKTYTLEKILDSKGNFVAYYCDICSPIKLANDNYEYYDWYLDIFRTNKGETFVLDKDEFEKGVVNGFLTEDEAKLAKSTLNKLLSLVTTGLDTSNTSSV